MISGFTLLSRLLGLVREQVFAALLGASLHADAFNIAFRIPNLLRDLFAEGALSAAFVPTYAAVVAREGREAAHRLANRVFALLAVLLGAVVLVAILGAPLIVWALARGFAEIEGKTELTVLVTQRVGAGDPRGAARALGHGCGLALVALPLLLGFAALLDGLLLRPNFVADPLFPHVVRADPAVAELASEYFWVRVPGIVPFLLFAAMRSWLYAQHRTRAGRRSPQGRANGPGSRRAGSARRTVPGDS